MSKLRDMPNPIRPAFYRDYVLSRVPKAQRAAFESMLDRQPYAGVADRVFAAVARKDHELALDALEDVLRSNGIEV